MNTQLRGWLKRGNVPLAPQRWRKYEIERLREYLKAGCTVLDIAGQLSRTPEEVAAQIGRLSPGPIRLSGPNSGQPAGCRPGSTRPTTRLLWSETHRLKLG